MTLKTNDDLSELAKNLAKYADSILNGEAKGIKYPGRHSQGRVIIENNQRTAYSFSLFSIKW